MSIKDINNIKFFKNDTTAKELASLTFTGPQISSESKFYSSKYGFEYNINSKNFRSLEEFEKPSDVLSLGCSFTFGTGLPQEFIWAEIFAKKNNFTLHNLASAGSSTTEQVTRAFHYIKKVGKPKIIIAMLPILRISCPVNIHRFYPKNINIKNKNINVYNANLDINNFETQSEAPHDPNKILPIEFTIYYSILFIKMLNQYCESLNIKFIWSFWEDFEESLAI